MKRKNVAIIIGHHYKDQGATTLLGETEYTYNMQVMYELTAIRQDRICYDVYIHNEINGYKTRIQDTVRRMDSIRYDLILELHFNASKVSEANGAEALHYAGNRWTEYFCNLFSLNISTLFGLNNRGAKPISRPDQRGFWMLAIPKWPTVILEPFFGTNEQDVETMTYKRKEYAYAIHRTISQFFDFNMLFDVV